MKKILITLLALLFPSLSFAASGAMNPGDMVKSIDGATISQSISAIQSQLNAVQASTGTVDLSGVYVSTGALQASVVALDVSTGVIQSQLNSIQMSTGTSLTYTTTQIVPASSTTTATSLMLGQTNPFPNEVFCNNPTYDSSYSDASICFNQNLSDGFMCPPTFPFWVSYKFAAPIVIDSYSITRDLSLTPPDAYMPAFPKNFMLQASSNNVTWTTLDTQTNQVWLVGTTTVTGYGYGFTNNNAYQWYRLYITANNGSGSYCRLGEIGLYHTNTTTTTVQHQLNYDPLNGLQNLSNGVVANMQDNLGNLTFPVSDTTPTHYINMSSGSIAGLTALRFNNVGGSVVIMSDENVHTDGYWFRNVLDESVLIGNGIHDEGAQVVQVGTGSGNGQQSVNVGHCHTNGQYGITIGFRCAYNLDYCIALGYFTLYNGVNSIAMGQYCQNTGDYGISLGYNNGNVTRNRTSSVCIGQQIQNTGVGGVSLGAFSTAASSSCAVGYSAKTNAWQSSSVGSYTVNNDTGTFKCGLDHAGTKYGEFGLSSLGTGTSTYMTLFDSAGTPWYISVNTGGTLSASSTRP